MESGYHHDIIHHDITKMADSQRLKIHLTFAIFKNHSHTCFKLSFINYMLKILLTDTGFGYLSKLKKYILVVIFSCRISQLQF